MEKASPTDCTHRTRLLTLIWRWSLQRNLDCGTTISVSASPQSVVRRFAAMKVVSDVRQARDVRTSTPEFARRALA